MLLSPMSVCIRGWWWRVFYFEKSSRILNTRRAITSEKGTWCSRFTSLSLTWVATVQEVPSIRHIKQQNTCKKKKTVAVWLRFDAHKHMHGFKLQNSLHGCVCVYASGLHVNLCFSNSVLSWFPRSNLRVTSSTMRVQNIWTVLSGVFCMLRTVMFNCGFLITGARARELFLYQNCSLKSAINSVLTSCGGGLIGGC